MSNELVRDPFTGWMIPKHQCKVKGCERRRARRWIWCRQHKRQWLRQSVDDALYETLVARGVDPLKLARLEKFS